MSAQEVLHAFHCEAPYLFLGAAFTAIGVVDLRCIRGLAEPDAILSHFSAATRTFRIRGISQYFGLRGCA